MSCNICGNSSCTCSCVAPVPGNMQPPSPNPPWARPVVSPNVENLSDSGPISLNNDVTYLKALLSANRGPYAMTLPNGNYQRQTKRIYIPAAYQNTTDVFNITGTFVGMTSITLNNLGHSAVLEWDGGGWQVVGGNPVIVP